MPKTDATTAYTQIKDSVDAVYTFMDATFLPGLKAFADKSGATNVAAVEVFVRNVNETDLTAFDKVVDACREHNLTKSNLPTEFYVLRAKIEGKHSAYGVILSSIAKNKKLRQANRNAVLEAAKMIAGELDKVRLALYSCTGSSSITVMRATMETTTVNPFSLLSASETLEAIGANSEGGNTQDITGHGGDNDAHKNSSFVLGDLGRCAGTVEEQTVSSSGPADTVTFASDPMPVDDDACAAPVQSGRTHSVSCLSEGEGEVNENTFGGEMTKGSDLWV